MKKTLKINEEKVLIFVGRLGLEKSVDFLIENHKDLLKLMFVSMVSYLGSPNEKESDEPEILEK